MFKNKKKSQVTKYEDATQLKIPLPSINHTGLKLFTIEITRPDDPDVIPTYVELVVTNEFGSEVSIPCYVSFVLISVLTIF